MIELLLEIGVIFVFINLLMWLFGVEMAKVLTLYLYLTLAFFIIYCVGLVLGLGIKTVIGC